MRTGVVIAAYNAAPWVGDAIASVLAQTHRDWRLVVVDDGSTDATCDVVATFSDPRIRSFRQLNAGVSAARNAGMRALGCTTQVVSQFAAEIRGEGRCPALLFLDADDWLAPDALSRLAAALGEAPGAVAASGPYAFAGSHRVRRPPSGDIVKRLLVRNPFANGGHLLLRTAAVYAAGGFLPGIAYGEDWELWIRIALQGSLATTRGRAPVLFVRQHAGGAYHRLAADPAAFAPCMDAIFGNPVLCARFGAAKLAAICRRTEAENEWIIGRELIRHGKAAEGRAWLRHSIGASPTPKRAVLLAAAHMLPLLPPGLRGPFRPYCLPRQLTPH